MQTSGQGTKAYHSENLVYEIGTFTANKVHFTWFLTLVLRVYASTFQRVKGACSIKVHTPLHEERPYQRK